MNGPVIVPLDGSRLAEQALSVALSVAAHNAVPLLLLRAVPMPREPIPLASGGMLTVDEQLDILRADAESYLRGRVEALLDTDVTVMTSVSVGNPPEVIADVADARAAGCVVIATHGRSGLTRWALGSVADRVLHLTHRPTLVVRPREVEEVDLSHVPTFRRLLVPLDGSELAEHALPYARDLAHVYDADLSLFRVLTVPAYGMYGLDTGVIESAYWETLREEAGDYLARIAAELETDGVRVEHSIGTEPVAEEILAYARDNDVDLIVMTTHAREGLSRVILGSVTDRIIRAGQVPVFVTRPPTTES